MSTEVELSTADTLIALQSQLASTHEQLAIAESTIALWRNAATALLHGSRVDRGVARATMLQLLREAEAGAGELARLRDAWAQIEAEFLPAMAHHYNDEDDVRFLAPMRAALKAMIE